MFGFSLNTLSLFGLVLSIGIVVDDAIVVVEAMERHISQGQKPGERQRRRWMKSLVPFFLLPRCWLRQSLSFRIHGGLQGQFYRRFALTIAISTILSTVKLR
ncbi:efflux RND transporter permease subunit [Salmonella enterica subsp. enterica]|nr:efflux RND transporter permease subunit [Salmonella enterica subsp. enterica]